MSNQPANGQASRSAAREIASYRPSWSIFEIVSMFVVFVTPIVINVTIAESPSAWALVGFGVFGVLALWFIGKSRKRDASVALWESPGGDWIVQTGTGNLTGREDSINPTDVTNMILPPGYDQNPGFLLIAQDAEGDQLAKLRVPARLVKASPDLRERLLQIAKSTPDTPQRKRVLDALG